MDILVLGGTVFVGRQFALAALSRRHNVTLFHRGTKGAGIVPGADEIFGDRDGGLEALGDRRWDVVVDMCGYLPRIVRQSAQALADRADRYLFVSSVSVYDMEGKESLNEDSEVATLDDPTTEEYAGPAYGALKYLCEQEVRAAFGDRSIIVRPGLIAGPYDPTNRFTYWVTRFAEGGRVLVPSRLDQPMQLIDVRDLAQFSVTLLERGTTGVFNACGPDSPKKFGDMVEACHCLNLGATPIYVDPQWLIDQGVGLWTELPLVLPPDGSTDALNRTDNSRAIQAGLNFRSWETTARDTLAWALESPPATPPRFGLDRAKEAEVLERLLP